MFFPSSSAEEQMREKWMHAVYDTSGYKLEKKVWFSQGADYWTSYQELGMNYTFRLLDLARD